MPKIIPQERWDAYFKARDTLDPNKAAKVAGISRSSAWRVENVANYNSSGREAKAEWIERGGVSVRQPSALNTQAKRALDDFAYFRLRYFGRKSTPWQVRTAEIIRKAHEDAVATMDRKFIVINCPPGAGKSTLVSHDIPMWLLCRDRSLRVLIGSATENLAGGYTEWIMGDLERTEPPPLTPKQAKFGAVEAQAALAVDFGKFRPENNRNWRTKAFRVAQIGDVEASSKEMSVTAFGRDSSYLGQRVDIALWDDLVNQETMGTAEAREKTLRKWQSEAEQRVEPGGVLFLIGQRLFADDLYRYCIDLPGEDEDGEEDENTRKYTHIVFKAHYEEHCKGLHAKDARAYDPANPENSGCLLEPLRLGWKYLKAQMRADDQQGTYTFNITYQQEDGDPSRSLVNPLWINGGVDKKTGEMFGGCWDEDRRCGIVPKVPGGLDVSVVSIDSSPTNYWAAQWWGYHTKSECRYLIDMRRAKMQVTDAISYNKNTGEWSGVLEDWWQTAKMQGAPFTHVIFELGSAERYFLQANDFQDWARMRGVVALGHETKRNRNDPQYGVQGLIRPVYRNGQVRLPGDVASGSRARMQPLVNEVTRWPEAVTTDCVMAQWFFEHNLPNLARRNTPMPRQPRPTWMSTIPDGRNLRLVGAGR